MNEHEPLDSLLGEWAAPEPTRRLDEGVRAAYRARFRRAGWRWLWRARVAIPVPALATLVLLAALPLFIRLWSGAQAPQRVKTVSMAGEYVTKIEAAGFSPLPEGTIRVIRSGGWKQ